MKSPPLPIQHGKLPTGINMCQETQGQCSWNASEFVRSRCVKKHLNIIFHHTEHIAVLPPIHPISTSPTYTQNTLLPSITNMHIYKDPTPPPQNYSIVPSKQLNCKRTTHSGTYFHMALRASVPQEYKPAKKTLVRLFLFQYCHFRKHNDFISEWLNRSVYYRFFILF